MMWYRGLLLWLPCLLLVVSCVGDVTPTYHSEPSICDSDDDCDTRKNEVCWRLYNGCYHGICMCDPNTHIEQPDTGYCKLVRNGNEECTNDDMCLGMMSCTNSTCQCRYGDMTPEGNFCLLSHHRLLGQDCSTSTDVCLQNTATGYIDTDVFCSGRHRRCMCRRGLEKYGQSCVKPRVSRCSKSYECEGGFICLNNQCSCPHKYWPVAQQTKCAKHTAIVNLPLGAHCDEINEKKYCDATLICHRCATESNFKCVKYSLLPTPDRAYLSTSSAACARSSPWTSWRVANYGMTAVISLFIAIWSSGSYCIRR